jgi:hypothetical protein
MACICVIWASEGKWRHAGLHQIWFQNTRICNCRHAMCSMSMIDRKHTNIYRFAIMTFFVNVTRGTKKYFDVLCCDLVCWTYTATRKIKFGYSVPAQSFLILWFPGYFNPLTPELNPSAQRCLTRSFTGDFASWTVHFVNICVENQQTQQLFIQFINYVRYLLHVSELQCHLQEAFLGPSERCSIEEQSIEYCG